MENQSEKLDHQVAGLPSLCLASSRIQFSVHTTHEHADTPRSSRLLRARRERPGDCRAAEKCDEFPPPHGAYSKAKDHGRSIADAGVGQWRASQ